MSNKQKIIKNKMGARDLLFDLFDDMVNSLILFTQHTPYRISKSEYAKKMGDRFDSRSALYYLKKQGLIKKVVHNKEGFFELTQKGHKQIAWHKIEGIQASREHKWDKYFRIVMFDIPNEKNSTRDIIRRKLEKIGFIQMQRSVFVYPFECKREIDAIAYYCSAGRYLKYMIANIIEGEKEIISKFLDEGILNLEDLA